MPPKETSWISNLFLILSLCIIPITCLKPDDPWTLVKTTTQYKDLPSCAQNCLLDVTSVTNCTAYSCVCSESSNGDNFLMGYTFITNCTNEGCRDRNITDKALLSFDEICEPAHTTTTTTTTTFVAIIPGPTSVVNRIPPESTSTHRDPPPTTTASPSLPVLQIKPRSYSHLPPCSKFTLNSCHHEQNDSNCGPTKRSTKWETYPGLATTLHCSTPECLCSSSTAFNIAYNALYNQSVFFCNYLPSVTDRISEEYDALQGALADFCDENGYSETIMGYGYRLVVNGTAQGDAAFEGCNLRDGDDKIKTPDIITMALGIPALLASITTLYLQRRQMKMAAASHANNSNNAAMPRPDMDHHPDNPNINPTANIALGNMNNRREDSQGASQQQQQQQRPNNTEDSPIPITGGPRPRPRVRASTSTRTRSATARQSARQLLQPSSPDTDTEGFTSLDSEGVGENRIMLNNIGRGSRSSRALMVARRGDVHEEAEEQHESAAEDGDADTETEDSAGEASRRR